MVDVLYPLLKSVFGLLFLLFLLEGIPPPSCFFSFQPLLATAGEQGQACLLTWVAHVLTTSFMLYGWISVQLFVSSSCVYNYLLLLAPNLSIYLRRQD